MPAGEPLVLLYDGLCGFCDRTVQFVLARDRAGTMRFAALQSAFAEDVIARHPEIRDVDSLILVRPDGSGETVLVKWRAVTALLHYLGGAWKGISILMRLIPPFIGDAAYTAFARIRYRIFGRYDACPIPSPGQRARFIDVIPP